MNQDLVKTSTKQRVIISVIAFLMIGSFIATYAGIVVSGGGSSSSTTNTNALVEKYESKYNQALEKFNEISKSDFELFSSFRNRVTAYNETNANSNGLQIEDLVVGNGRELTDGDTNYLAHYIGWCADETIFDTTLNSTTGATGFSNVLSAQIGLIEGWEVGVIGMKIGGVRELTIPGELAYKDVTQICGGYNKPLKFIIMAVENSGEKGAAAEELTNANIKLNYAQNGLDYDELYGE